MELRRQDGLLRPFPCRHLWIPLMADETVCNEQFTQLVGGAVEHCTIGKGFVHLQMALFAMSLVYDVEDVKHVGTMPLDFLCLRMILSDPS